MKVNLHVMDLKSAVFAALAILSTTFAFGQRPGEPLTEQEVRDIASTAKEAEIVKQNSTLMQDGYLYYAEILADKLLEINPQNPNYSYRKGFLILEIRKDYQGAIPMFQKAVQDIDQNYDMYSHRETSSPPDAFYHLASCYHLNEDIDKAIENYNKFLEVSRSKSELIPVVKLRLKQCEEAKRQMASPVNVTLKNIGDQVNTKYPEYSPVVSLDGSALYFTARKPWENGETENFRDLALNQYPEDVYVSYLDFDSSWTKPERLDFCKTRRNEASISMSGDERKIYLYEDTTGNGDIFTTEFYHAKFQEIEPLDMKKVNTDSWETHCMMSHNKRRFFFVSDRPGGFGGRDIYVMERKKNGNWTRPKNLGPGINTPNDEDSPFIAVDNKTLYYASNGEKSIGGFDLFKSEMQDDSTWIDGSNLGYPFNSTNDDIFYTTTLDGRRGYMTSYRKDGQGEKDIYEIFNDYLGVRNIAVLKGLIKTVDDKPIPEDFAVNIKLVCVDCDESEDRQIFPRLRDGVFMTGLTPCKTYRLEYMNVTDSVSMGDDTFDTDCETSYQEIYREVLLDVDTRKLVIIEDTIVIDPIDVNTYPDLEFMHYFAYNKNKLTTKKGELKQFVKDVEVQLKGGRESITINVYSSASNVPTKTFGTNEKLTKTRAENMKYDLVAYFEQFEEYKGKVNVVIVTAKVSGPEYVKDASDKEKYSPYQYVGLKTE
jgi:tetratricopeptide (TPR) repeat protein